MRGTRRLAQARLSDNNNGMHRIQRRLVTRVAESALPVFRTCLRSVLTLPQRVPAGVLVVPLALLLFLLMLTDDSITALTEVPLWVMFPPLVLLLLLLVFAQHGQLTVRTVVPVWTLLVPVTLLLLLLGLARTSTLPSPIQQVATRVITWPLLFGQAKPLHPSPVTRSPVAKRVRYSGTGCGSATDGATAHTSHAPVPTATAPGTMVLHHSPRTAVAGQAERGARHVFAQGSGTASASERRVAPRMIGGRTPRSAAGPDGRSRRRGQGYRNRSLRGGGGSRVRLHGRRSGPEDPTGLPPLPHLRPQGGRDLGPRLGPAVAAGHGAQPHQRVHRRASSAHPRAHPRTLESDVDHQPVGALHAATAPQIAPRRKHRILDLGRPLLRWGGVWGPAGAGPATSSRSAHRALKTVLTSAHSPCMSGSIAPSTPSTCAASPCGGAGSVRSSSSTWAVRGVYVDGRLKTRTFATNMSTGSPA
jgi:hypothetical protein